MAVSRRQKAHHTIPGNILLFQIQQILKKVVQKFQSANFVTKPSVAAVLQGQQPTFWGVLYKVKQKLDAAGIQACIAINKKDDDKRAISKNAQQAHGEVI